MDERRIVTLTRDLKLSALSFGSFGEIDTGKYKYKTLERPIAGDHPCIPIALGGYDVDWTDTHPHHNPCYEIMRVPGRTAILIHTANWYQELLGCIALGMEIKEIDGKYGKQLGVSGSGVALKAFLEDMKRQNFRLIIKEA